MALGKFDGVPDSNISKIINQVVANIGNVGGAGALSTEVVASGGTTSVSNGYKYHKFTNLGNTSFVVSSGGVVDVLILAGGGGGGGMCYSLTDQHGGGGGGGGFQERTGVSVTPQTYTITVGDGGAGGVGGYGLPSPPGSAGGNSSALSYTSYGGHGGGATTGNEDSTSGGTSGTASKGGSGLWYGGCGGGGAGGNGEVIAYPSHAGGDGGVGALSNIANLKYCGGGGGGHSNSTQYGEAVDGGGNGARGDGGTYVDPKPGTPNTGGGGGGTRGSSPVVSGGKGGSGMVIIRYAIVPIISPYATGGTITESGGRKIHTFVFGSFFPLQTTSNLSCIKFYVKGAGNYPNDGRLYIADNTTAWKQWVYSYTTDWTEITCYFDNPTNVNGTLDISFMDYYRFDLVTTGRTVYIDNIRFYDADNNIIHSNMCESTTDWAVYNGTRSLDSTNKQQGTYSIKVISTSSGAYLWYSPAGTWDWKKYSTTKNFEVTSGTLNIDYLIVAGGGGGGISGTGDNRGGGGGAGGLVTGSTSISVGTYPVVVGNGGLNVVNGIGSSFNSLTAVGGGKGGSAGVAGSNGGSGGGGGAISTAGNFAGGSPTSGQGYAGGQGGTDSVNYRRGGGGGGAGAVGANASVGFQNGGDGIQSSISGTPTYYGGGGGGGGATNPGGNGGGGAGSGTVGLNGTADTGGGGGGSNANRDVAGSGGSGIVIISYPF